MKCLQRVLHKICSCGKTKGLLKNIELRLSEKANGKPATALSSISASRKPEMTIPVSVGEYLTTIHQNGGGCGGYLLSREAAR